MHRVRKYAYIVLLDRHFFGKIDSNINVNRLYTYCVSRGPWTQSWYGLSVNYCSKLVEVKQLEYQNHRVNRGQFGNSGFKINFFYRFIVFRLFWICPGSKDRWLIQWSEYFIQSIDFDQSQCLIYILAHSWRNSWAVNSSDWKICVESEIVSSRRYFAFSDYATQRRAVIRTRTSEKNGCPNVRAGSSDGQTYSSECPNCSECSSCSECPNWFFGNEKIFGVFFFLFFLVCFCFK